MKEVINPVMSMSEFQAMIRLAAKEEEAAKAASADRWVELGIVAPSLFGALCFAEGTDARDKLRKAVRDAFPTAEAPARDDKSDAANKIREARKHASTCTSVAMDRMKKYYERAVGVSADADTIKMQSLDVFAAGMIKKLIGHGEKVKPMVYGESKAIAALVQHLTKLAGDAYKPVKVVAGTKAKAKAKRASPVVTQAANDGNNLTALINGIVKAA